MKIHDENSILEDVREGLGLGREDSSFDAELILHINAAISFLEQNGLNTQLIVYDTTSKWVEILTPEVTVGVKRLIPLYITLTVKLIFDPPAPSMVEYYSAFNDQILWRVRNEFQGGDIK